MLVPRQQITGPAEPGKENGKSQRVEQREMPSVAAVAAVRSVNVNVGKMEMQM